MAQMFNLLSLGLDGYTRISRVDLANARVLSRALENSGYYKVSITPLDYLGNLSSALT